MLHLLFPFSSLVLFMIFSKEFTLGDPPYCGQEMVPLPKSIPLLASYSPLYPSLLSLITSARRNIIDCNTHRFVLTYKFHVAHHQRKCLAIRYEAYLLVLQSRSHRAFHLCQLHQRSCILCHFYRSNYSQWLFSLGWNSCNTYLDSVFPLVSSY